MTRFSRIWNRRTALRASSVTLALSVAALALMTSAPVQAQQKQSAVRYVSIGTGGVTGVYYPAGGAICRLMNKKRRIHGIRCSVESTGGSVANINALRDHDMDFAIVQTDAQYFAVHGDPPFQSQGPFKELRSLFALHADVFTVVARVDANIRSLDDLKGKRVNIGNIGSGQRSTMDVLMAAKGWGVSDFAETLELTSAQQSKALCDNKIDAMVFTVGHPNASIKEAVMSCDTVLVNITGPVIDKLVNDFPYYRAATIPGKMYRGTDKDVHTFGVGATVVASSSLADDVVYEIVKTVFENFENFRLLHPALARLKKEKMVSAGLTAPLHPGAMRYFKEAGLIK